jgi:hypothetical protein
MRKRFFAILECELLARTRFDTHEQALQALFSWIAFARLRVDRPRETQRPRSADHRVGRGTICLTAGLADRGQVENPTCACDPSLAPVAAIASGLRPKPGRAAGGIGTASSGRRASMAHQLRVKRDDAVRHRKEKVVVPAVPVVDKRCCARQGMAPHKQGHTIHIDTRIENR